MELGKQIRKYRNEQSLSQDSLAEKIYVSRQTISNWENSKSYPDVNSLVLLSDVFGVSLDQLIKGDVATMKEKISKQEQQFSSHDQQRFERLGQIFTVLFFAAIITPVPLVHFLSYVGIGIYVVQFSVTMYVAILVEKEKKKLDIQTYREIIAFTEGKTLGEIEKAREEGKRPYQTVLSVLVTATITLIVTIVLAWILGAFPA
ncbi:MAG: helix-turn-helix transcriptional regulator [Eubacteriales bacterium]|nr:helix-turn-helix transcriptional regulator [Eubacteriales bacterium]